jgi:hypothetical protein
MQKNTLEVVKFGLRPDEAAHALGSEKLLQASEEAGWLKPVIFRHKLKLFDKGDIAGVWLRIRNGEQPFTPSNKPPGGIRRRKTNDEAAVAAAD